MTILHDVDRLVVTRSDVNGPRSSFDYKNRVSVKISDRQTSSPWKYHHRSFMLVALALPLLVGVRKIGQIHHSLTSFNTTLPRSNLGYDSSTKAATSCSICSLLGKTNKQTNKAPPSEVSKSASKSGLNYRS